MCRDLTEDFRPPQIPSTPAMPGCHTAAAEIPGDRPLLEGEDRLARYARFADLAAVDAGRDGLTAVTHAWCDAKE